MIKIFISVRIFFLTNKSTMKNAKLYCQFWFAKNGSVYDVIPVRIDNVFFFRPHLLKSYVMHNINDQSLVYNSKCKIFQCLCCIDCSSYKPTFGLILISILQQSLFQKLLVKLFMIYLLLSRTIIQVP